MLEGLKAQAGDLLEVTFTGESIELRPTKRTFLDLMGSVHVPGPQDFKIGISTDLGSSAKNHRPSTLTLTRQNQGTRQTPCRFLKRDEASLVGLVVRVDKTIHKTWFR